MTAAVIIMKNFFSGTQEKPNKFQDLAEGLLDCSLAKERWTHNAHLTATLYLLRERPEIDLHQDLPEIIKSYNLVTGTANTDQTGFHATLTHFYIEKIRGFNANLSKRVSTNMACRLILRSALANRNYPLQYYSRETLFSVRARRQWVAPDLGSLGFRFLAA